MKYLEALNNELKKTKKEMSTRLLWLELLPDNIIKSKAMKLIVKKTLPDYK